MEERIKLTTKNTISFKRVNTSSCTHYEIYATCKGSEKNVEFLLDTVENPKMQSPFRKSKVLDYNEAMIWEMNEEIIAKTSIDVNVYINELKLTTIQYTFNPKNRILNIHIKANPNDNIKIEYNVDRLSYVHNSDIECTYRIVPIFKDGYRLGEHSLLNY